MLTLKQIRDIERLVKGPFIYKKFSEICQGSERDALYLLPIPIRKLVRRRLAIQEANKAKAEIIENNRQKRIQRNIEIIEKVTKICEEYPELSVKDKAKKAGISFSKFVSVKQKLGIKQQKYIVPKRLSEKKEAIRKMYSEGIYTYQEVGEKFGVSREYVRQVAGDIRIALKNTNNLKITIKRRSAESRYMQRDIMYDRIIKLFEIAKVQYNKEVLTISEITLAYYNLYTKTNIDPKPKLREHIFSKLAIFIADPRYTEKDKQIIRLPKRNGYKLETNKSINSYDEGKNLFEDTESLRKLLHIKEILNESCGERLSNEIYYIFALAYKKYNKTILNRKEIFAAYYKIFNKKTTLKKISNKIQNIRFHDNSPYIEKVEDGISTHTYCLTQYGKEQITEFLNLKKENEMDNKDLFEVTPDLAGLLNIKPERVRRSFFAENVIKIFVIAEHLNKPRLKLSEITTAYYKLFYKKESSTILTANKLSVRLSDLVKKGYLERVITGVYTLAKNRSKELNKYIEKAEETIKEEK